MDNKAIPPTLPAFNKLMYSLGYIGISTVDRIMAGFLNYFYAPPAGVGMPQLLRPETIGLIFFIGRGLDTFFDPMCAFMSDRCKSPRGRRMPFMLWGGVPLAASMALLFFPPARQPGIANAVFLAAVLSTFYFLFSFYVCPYLGLLPELGHTPQERMGMTTQQGIFMLLGTVVAMVGAPILVKNYGYREMAVAMAVLAVITMYLPVLFIDEKKYCTAEPSHLSLLSTIVETLRNKPFVIYLFGNLSFWFGFNIVSSCVLYYVTALLRLPEDMAALYFGIALGTALVFIPIVNKIADMIGKRLVMIISLAMFLVLLPSIYFFGDSRLPIDSIVFSYIIISLIGVPLATLFIVPNAIVADLTDYDQKLTGLRREAIYFGTQGLFLKIDLGVSSLLMNLLFKYFGNSLDNPMGIRMTGFIGGFFALTGVIAFLLFPKDLNAHAEAVLRKRNQARQD